MSKITRIITRHWKSLIALNVLIGTVSLIAIQTSSKTWNASAKLILPTTSTNLDANLGTLGSLRNGNAIFSDRVNPLKVQESILMSDTLLEEVLKDDTQKDKFKKFSKYKSLFTTSPQEESTIISLTVAGSTPEIAQERITSLIEVYQKRLNELRKANSTARQKFSLQELERAKANLDVAQTNLANFQQTTGIVADEEQTKGIVSNISVLTNAKSQAIAQVALNEKRVESLSQRLSLMPQEAISSLSLGENKDFQFLQSKLSELEINLLKLRVNFKETHPEVQNLVIERQKLISLIQKQIAQVTTGGKIDKTINTDRQGRALLIQQLITAETEAKAQQKQAEQIDRQIQQLRTLLSSLPKNQAKLAQLQQQVDFAEGVYKGLVAQIQQNNINAFDAYPNVEVLDPPKVNPKPVSPKLSLMIINAFLASVIGSIALLLFLERRNPLLNPKDLQDEKFPVVASIPKLKHSYKTWYLKDETELEFQRLASAISLQNLANRRLLVTSAMMGEGKTIVTLKLACALVDLGFRVLMVDGDFRRAQLTHCLGYMNTPSSDSDVPISIKPNLDLLPTVPRQNKIAEMIRRGDFDRRVVSAESSRKYDYIIFDSAPVILTSETALMAAAIRNTLFVVKPGKSYCKPVTDSLRQLNQHQAYLVGLVVNGLDNHSSKSFYNFKVFTNK
ncbi:tyrosine-protein kinase domain-containing protein [Mastigocoleus sp. MO_188.B34]|uniref:GumC family protein n=1 Tax=Mastigocoleus sp. MO_188.B34 TaxID=3036635 RepID=UPI002607D6A4|nr:tyrosine-protein kinase domain-containing protein [Mastigocoleus sp. MO_188.B34]MDJ0696975.1 GNVR domain-containing protein [Mastigocoleus sp. MO_188.B34]